MKLASLIRRHVLPGIYKDVLTNSFIKLSQRKTGTHVPHSLPSFIVQGKLFGEMKITVRRKDTMVSTFHWFVRRLHHVLVL